MHTHEEDVMTIADKSVLVTGANPGTQRALVDEALRKRAKRVYAGSRQPMVHPDARVTPLVLDVTVEALDILINNAGVAPYDGLTDRGTIEQAMGVDLSGPYAVTQAFWPLLTRSGGGHRQQHGARPAAPHTMICHLEGGDI